MSSSNHHDWLLPARQDCMVEKVGVDNSAEAMRPPLQAVWIRHGWTK